jgi:hypothetical protein
VLGHHDVVIDQQPVLLAYLLERMEEIVSRLRSVEFWKTVVATEGEVVVLAGLLEVLQSPRYVASLLEEFWVVCDV